MKSHVVIGGLGRDIYVRVKSFDQLPSVFTRHIGESIRYREITPKFGSEWNIPRLEETLDLRRRTSSYGGRAAHIAYQVSKLGGKVELVTEAGEDFDHHYDGFFGGGYLTHLKKAKVDVDTLCIELEDETHKDPEDLKTFLEKRYAPDIYDKSFLIALGKSIPTIICVSSEAEAGNVFFVDDRNAANLIESVRPIPARIIRDAVGVLLTTCESTGYMNSIVDFASKLNKEILIDIGSRVDCSFLRKALPKADIIFGNPTELECACMAFDINGIAEETEKIAQLFHMMETRKTKIIVVQRKECCSATILQRNREPIEVGPVTIPNRVSNIGCCDGMAAGYLALHQRDLPIELCVKGGLVIGASIWGVEGVQEGMLELDEFLERFSKEFPSDAEYVRRGLTNKGDC